MRRKRKSVMNVVSVVREDVTPNAVPITASELNARYLRDKIADFESKPARTRPVAPAEMNASASQE